MHESQVIMAIQSGVQVLMTAFKLRFIALLNSTFSAIMI
jgi:hypothetical protein